jgi:peptide/nickel transport system ATP-binding protein/glutathione transport system ATP-binding protein
LSGSVKLDGQEIIGLSQSDLRETRQNMQMVFQDPFASLNPRVRLIDQVAEPLRNYGVLQGKALREEVARLFRRVELPSSFMTRYPHELSGGQRQRVAIARALAAQPRYLLLDEAFSALDAITRGDVHDAFLNVRRRLHVTTLLVTHDLREAVVLADRIAVLRRGRLEQIGPTREVVSTPATPYVAELIRRSGVVPS